MLNIKSIIIKAFSLMVFFLILQIPPVFLGLRLAYEEVHAKGLPMLLSISFPKDKFIIKEDRTVVRGYALRAKQVIVDDAVVDLDEEGKFEAGLVLVPGKNFVEVIAEGPSHEKIKLTRRILRLISFSDIETTYKNKRPHWAKHYIISLATLGIIEGYPDQTYLPKKWVSKGELATWIVRAKRLATPALAEDPFFDVPKEHWRAPFIRAATKAGYIEGYSKAIFGIDDGISRGSVVEIFKKVEKLKSYGKTKKIFTDVSLKNKNADAIYRAYRAGLIIGTTPYNHKFEGDRDMNRAEAATIISRIPSVKSDAVTLYNWRTHYDRSRLCRVNTAPVILEAKATPKEVPADSKTPTTLTAKIYDRQGLKDLSFVKIDLRKIGGPADAIMYDDGTGGDAKAGDGIYTLGLTINKNIESGVKKIKVTAVDRSGWEGYGMVELIVVKSGL